MESVAECGGLVFLMCGLLELCVCVCCFCPCLCLSALCIIGAASDVHMVCMVPMLHLWLVERGCGRWLLGCGAQGVSLFFGALLCGEHVVDRTIGYENREGRAHERRVAGCKRRWSEGERVWSRLRSVVDWCS